MHIIIVLDTVVLYLNVVLTYFAITLCRAVTANECVI